ncbi:MAG: hypothetical protein U1E70_12480 [Acetobacteraceae bacterium]|nr:hypothetical protein [Pseudomonadota bacterium]
MAQAGNIDLNLEPAVKAALDKAAAAERRSSIDLVEKIVVEWLRQNRYLPPLP